MKYFKVPFVGKVLDINYNLIEHSVLDGGTHGFVSVDDSVIMKSSWEEITEETFLAMAPKLNSELEPKPVNNAELLVEIQALTKKVATLEVAVATIKADTTLIKTDTTLIKTDTTLIKSTNTVKTV